MKIFIVLVAFMGILYAVSYLPAKWMVKKRILLAKMFCIGHEPTQKIERMKGIARQVLYEMITPPYKYRNGMWNGFLITASNENARTMVKVEIDNACVCVWDDGDERVFHKSFSENETTLIITGLLAIILLVIIGLFAIVI